MIAALSLNPSIDRTLSVADFCVGGLNRVTAQKDVAAGKGVNVALATAALGEPAECIGFMYRDGGSAFEKRLHENGVASDFVWCDGAVRINVKVFDEKKGEITELNQSGIPVSGEQLEQMRTLVRRHAKTAQYMVLSGSMPPSCPADFYQTLGQIATEEGCRVLLDADGEHLKQGVKAKPFLIKPNRYELELLCGRRLEGIDDILAAAQDCVKNGVGAVAVSMGGDGALITDGQQAWRAPALKVKIASTVAAGDSMLAGLAAGLCRKMNLWEAFRLGVAAATARCATPPEQTLCAAACQDYFEQIQMERLF